MGLFNKIKNGLSKAFNFDASYDGASQNGRVAFWRPNITSPNSILTEDFSTLRSRARDLSRKYPEISNAYETIASSVVGTGIRMQTNIYDDNLRDEIKKLWDSWCLECDLRGVDSFTTMLYTAVRERWEVGEVFFRRIYTKDGIVPIKYQLLESEMLDHTKQENLQNGCSIKGGIEFNKSGERIAYHFFIKHPGEDYSLNETIRIPADEIIHYYNPLRAGQIRGIPEISSGMLTARDMQLFDEAHLVSKQNMAMMMGFIESATTNPLAGSDLNDIGGKVPGAVSDNKNSALKMESGTMLSLNPGEKVSWMPQQPTDNNYESFTRRIGRKLASSLKLSYEEFSLDASQDNFNSIKFALNESRKKHTMEQIRLIQMVLARIFKDWLDTAVYSGSIVIKNYNEVRNKINMPQWQSSGGWYSIDPLKETNAIIKRLDAGLISPQEACAEMGIDYDETLKLRKIAKNKEEQAGLYKEQDK